MIELIGALSEAKDTSDKKGSKDKKPKNVKIKKRNKGSGKIDPKKSVTKKSVKVEPPKEGIPEDELEMLFGKGYDKGM